MLFLPCVYSVQRVFMFACCSLCQRASGALCGEFHVHEHARAQTIHYTPPPPPPARAANPPAHPHCLVAFCPAPARQLLWPWRWIDLNTGRATIIMQDIAAEMKRHIKQLKKLQHV